MMGTKFFLDLGERYLMTTRHRSKTLSSFGSQYTLSLCMRWSARWSHSSYFLFSFLALCIGMILFRAKGFFLLPFASSACCLGWAAAILALALSSFSTGTVDGSLCLGL